MADITRIDNETRRAWQENWQHHEVERILEIFNYPRVKKQISLYLKYLPKDKPILEGGCGLGPYLIYLKKQGYDVVGVDYNEEPLKKIKAYDKSLSVSVMDVRNLYFDNEAFGGYLSLGVIEHFPEGPRKAIQEAYRVLKKGGVFIVQVPTKNIFLILKYPLELLKRSRLLRTIFKKRHKPYYWQQYFKKKRLKEILEKEGFAVEEIVPMGHEHSVISFSAAFRDKASYDGANAAGLVLSRFCESCLPWLTADDMALICRKKD